VAGDPAARRCAADALARVAPPCWTLRLPPRPHPTQQGQRYPADPPRTEELVAVMRHAGANLHGDRVRALIVILWRAGLRIQALSLTELDLGPRRGSVLVRRDKGGLRREIGMDACGFEHVQPWSSMPAAPVWRASCAAGARWDGTPSAQAPPSTCATSSRQAALSGSGSSPRSPRMSLSSADGPGDPAQPWRTGFEPSSQNGERWTIGAHGSRTVQ
jgi:hypothetical protein